MQHMNMKVLSNVEQPALQEHSLGSVSVVVSHRLSYLLRTLFGFPLFTCQTL